MYIQIHNTYVFIRFKYLDCGEAFTFQVFAQTTVFRNVFLKIVDQKKKVKVIFFSLHDTLQSLKIIDYTLSHFIFSMNFYNYINTMTNLMVQNLKSHTNAMYI